MKILLINSMLPFLSKPKPESYFPMGIGFLASYLMPLGYNIEILDILGDTLDKTQVEAKIKSNKWDLIGISAISGQYIYVKNLCKLIKETCPTAKIIVGGVLPTHNYKEILNFTSADFCVIGHGWEPLKSLLEKNLNPENIPGIAYKNSRKEIGCSPSVLMPRVVYYPRPAYELFNMEKYLHAQLHSSQTNQKIGYIITGFGCPFQCGFCSQLDRHYTYRAIKNIMDEIIFLQKEYDIKGVHVGDECLFINKDHLTEFCHEIKKTGLIWSAQSRANLITEELLTMVKDANCKSLGYGIESGSPKMLQAMIKNQTVEQIEKAVKLTAKFGLSIKVQLLFGYPGDNQETIQETVDLFDKLAYPPRRFNILTPLPGSRVYKDLLEQNKITNENEYLERVSCGLGGAHPTMLAYNCTEMSDQEVLNTVLKAEKQMAKNYERHKKKGDGLEDPEIDTENFLLKTLKSIKRFLKKAYFKMTDGAAEESKVNLIVRKKFYFWDFPDPAEKLNIN